MVVERLLCAKGGGVLMITHVVVYRPSTSHSDNPETEHTGSAGQPAFHIRSNISVN